MRLKVSLIVGFIDVDEILIGQCHFRQRQGLSRSQFRCHWNKTSVL